MIEAELWVSFVSMLRAYAAAASLDAGDAGKVRVQSKGETVTISAFACQIEMRFATETGEGVWEKRLAGRPVYPGTFSIEPDGRMRIGGAVKDLDHATIDLIASVTQRREETW